MDDITVLLLFEEAPETSPELAWKKRLRFTPAPSIMIQNMRLNVYQK